MKSITWKQAVAREAKRLANLGDLPPRLRKHPALTAGAKVCALAGTGLIAILQDRLVLPILEAVVSDATATRDEALVVAICRHFGKALVTQRADFGVRDWVGRAGFDEFIVSTIEMQVQDEHRHAMLSAMSAGTQLLTRHIRDAYGCYRKALMARDMPSLPEFPEWGSTSTLKWLLATDLAGKPARQTALARRSQALTTFAAFSMTLRTNEVTLAIDEAKPLLPVLQNTLSLPRPIVRAMVCNRPVTEALGSGDTDWSRNIEKLLSHEVPLHEWPGQGRPGRPEDWMASPWITTRATHPLSSYLRADFHSDDPSRERDAVAGFMQDIFEPVFDSRLSAEDIEGEMHHQAGTGFQRHVETSGRSRPLGSAASLRLFRQVLVGPRQKASFIEAVDKWHRRAAAVAALRAEKMTDSPGWPGLCPAWTSPCTRYTIKALTTAAELVENGNHHNHCVGGYYGACRNGNTQILSLDEDGVSAATVEVHLGADLKRPTLAIGQFKGRNDDVAGQHLHPVLRAFLSDVRSGQHRLNLRRMAAYRKDIPSQRARERPVKLTLAHACSAFPLYRSLLPRSMGCDFDTWCADSGIVDGIDALLLARPASPTQPDRPTSLSGL